MHERPDADDVGSNDSANPCFQTVLRGYLTRRSVLRAGDHHDGMAWFGLSAGGMADATASTRGLIAINHESITQVYLHANGPTAAPRPADEALKEINAHGVAVFEVARGTGGWAVVPGSSFNRRITPNTWTTIAGPAAGHP